MLLPFTQAKQALDRLKKLCIGRDLPDAGACARFDKSTQDGEDMSAAQKLLAAAVASIVGKKEERAVASLFTPGGTHAMKGEFARHQRLRGGGLLVVLPEARRMSHGGIADLIAALALPADARVDQRVPKKLLLEQGAPTAADKRQIQDGIEELIWVAALKPTNIGVPAFRDEVREYLEIAVLTATLRAAAKATRLTELIHRAIPYPVVLVTAQGDGVSLSLAHKRWSQGETGAVVIEDVHRTAPLRADSLAPNEAAFLASLALSRLPTRDLFALYQGWLDRVAALEAATITGAFAVPDTDERAAAQRDALAAHARLQRDIARLRAQAQREKQLNRRVELNLAIKRLESELTLTKETLTWETLNEKSEADYKEDCGLSEQRR